MEMVYLGRSEVCYLPQPGGRCFNTACLGEWIEGRELCAGDDYEGFQKIVTKEHWVNFYSHCFAIL